jgi:hypothetical protein
MDSGFFWIWILWDFVKWSPLVMLIFGTFGFLIFRKKSKRMKIVSVAGGILLPVIWVLSVIDFFFIVAIAGVTFGEDFGFTDRFDVPLHNNYQWTAMDSTDSALIYNLAGTDGGVLSLIPDTHEPSWNVLEIQEQGDWLANGLWSNPSQDAAPDGWFLFNTRTHQRIDARSEQELQVDAAEKGFRLNLQSCHDFYLRHHFSWIAVLEIILLLAVPVIGLDLLRKLAIRFVLKKQESNQGSN